MLKEEVLIWIYHLINILINIIPLKVALEVTTSTLHNRSSFDHFLYAHVNIIQVIFPNLSTSTVTQHHLYIELHILLTLHTHHRIRIFVTSNYNHNNTCFGPNNMEMFSFKLVPFVTATTLLLKRKFVKN